MERSSDWEWKIISHLFWFWRTTLYVLLVSINPFLYISAAEAQLPRSLRVAYLFLISFKYTLEMQYISDPNTEKGILKLCFWKMVKTWLFCDTLQQNIFRLFIPLVRKKMWYENKKHFWVCGNNRINWQYLNVKVRLQLDPSSYKYN